MRRTPLEFVDHPAPYTGGLYRGAVSAVIDGDTLDVLLDLGCNHYDYQTVRLAGINAPERGTDAGTAATEFVKQWVSDEQAKVVLVTVKDREKFGRYLGILYATTYSHELAPSLNERLLDAGHAVAFMADGIQLPAYRAWVAARLWGTP